MKADLNGAKNVLQNKVCQSLYPGHSWGRGKGERCMGQVAGRDSQVEEYEKSNAICHLVIEIFGTDELYGCII